MKKFLFICLLLATGLAAKAQTTLVATLLDPFGNNVGTFYGANALKEANNAADHGYTIVLSPGQFNSAITLNKLITIRGAGMCAVPEKNVQPTILNGSITFACGWDVIETFSDCKVTMEGICTRDDVYFANNCGLKNAQFTKCTFGNFYKDASVGQYRWENVSFVDCYLLGHTFLPGESSVSFYNCVLKLISSYRNQASAYMENCVAIVNGNGSNGYGINKGLLRNSFLLNQQNGYMNPPAACVCEYCFSTQSTFFNNQVGKTNTVLDKEFSEVFKNFNGANWTDTYNFYELTSWAKSNTLGGDGSQMGIYGGQAAPFTPLTSAPLITRFSAPESTTNGQLKVTIQVELPQ